MANVIPELNPEDEANKEIDVPAPEPPPPPTQQINVLGPFCMGCCTGISSFVFIICCTLFFTMFFFARRSPDALSTTYTPNAIDAARYETKVAIAVQDAEAESAFLLEFTEEEFGSWLHRSYDWLVEEEVLDLLIINDIGEFRIRYSFKDWVFQTKFDNDKMLIYGETSIFERIIRLGTLIEAEVVPSRQLSIDGPPLTVNILSVQIGNVKIENDTSDNEEIEFIYRIERDLEDVLIALLAIPGPYRINQIDIVDKNMVINGFVDIPVVPTSTPEPETPTPTATSTPEVENSPTSTIFIEPTPEQFLPDLSPDEEATEAPANEATPGATEPSTLE